MSKKQQILLLIGLGYFVYANSLFNGFVWDDGLQIVQNQFVHSGQFLYYFFHTIGPYYRPLMLASFTALYSIFGVQSFFFHFFQVSIHIINAILVYLFFSSFFNKRPYLPFFLSLLFLVHPINVEAVVYSSELQETLFLFFGLLSLLFIQTNYTHRFTPFVVYLLSLLGFLSKETFILFIVTQVLFVYFFQRRNMLYQILISSLSTITYTVLRVSIVGLPNPRKFDVFLPHTVSSASLTERLINLPDVLVYYIKTFFFPKDLAISQYWWSTTLDIKHLFLPLAILLLFLLCCIFLGLYTRKKNKSAAPLFLFFSLWFVLGLAMHSQIIPLDMTVADRWFYFPIIGILGMIGVGLHILPEHKAHTHAVLIFLICIATLFAFRTIFRNTDWYNAITLFSHDESLSQNSADLEFNLGLELGKQKAYQAAETHLQKALILFPNSPRITYTLCLVYNEAKEYLHAETCFQKAVSFEDPTYTYLSYGSFIKMLIIERKYEAAQHLSQEAVKQWPTNRDMWLLLGFSSYLRGENITALTAFTKAHALSQDSLTSYYYEKIRNNMPIQIQL